MLLGDSVENSVENSVESDTLKDCWESGVRGGPWGAEAVPVGTEGVGGAEGPNLYFWGKNFTMG